MAEDRFEEYYEELDEKLGEVNAAWTGLLKDSQGTLREAKRRNTKLMTIVAVVVLVIAVIAVGFYIKSQHSEFMKDFLVKQSVEVNGLTVYGPKSWTKKEELDYVRFSNGDSLGASYDYNVLDLYGQRDEEEWKRYFREMVEDIKPFLKDSSIQKISVDGCRYAYKVSNITEEGGANYYNAMYIFVCGDKEILAGAHYGSKENIKNEPKDLETMILSADFKN